MTGLLIFSIALLVAVLLSELADRSVLSIGFLTHANLYLAAFAAGITIATVRSTCAMNSINLARSSQRC